MHAMSPEVKRPYRSRRRAAAAAETRARIRKAAARLFVERGYTGTTLRDIAEAAGVGERTLYDAFPTKATLFGHTLDVATVGDEQPVAVEDRPEMVAAREAPDAGVAISSSWPRGGHPWWMKMRARGRPGDVGSAWCQRARN